MIGAQWTESKGQGLRRHHPRVRVRTSNPWWPDLAPGPPSRPPPGF